MGNVSRVRLKYLGSPVGWIMIDKLEMVGGRFGTGISGN